MARKRTLTSELESMNVGDTKEFPASQSVTMRSMASTLGFKLDRTYSTETDRERRVLIIKRTR